MDAALKESKRTIQDSDWEELVRKDGNESSNEQIASCLHTMVKTNQAFMLVVQRRLKDEAQQPDSQPDLFPDLLGNVDDESVACGRYVYRAIATNLDGDGLN